MPTPSTPQPPLRRHHLTYADITKGKHTTEMDENNPQSCTLSTFLAEFKLMFNHVLQQNSMILNMLTMLIIKSSYSQIPKGGTVEFQRSSSTHRGN